jgi:hypothetical protein
MNRTIGGWAVFGVGLLMITGCPVMPPGGGESTFTATLTDDAEIPRPTVPTNGSGEGTFTLNAARIQLTYRITARDLTGPVTLAHFHRGPAGEAGPPVETITERVQEDNGQVTVNGTWNVTSQNVDDLLDGNIYVNLHTDANPAGEIRGQIELQEQEP